MKSFVVLCSGGKVVPYCRPMLTMRSRSVGSSSSANGVRQNSRMRSFSNWYVSVNAVAISASEPTMAAGSGIPQCAVIGCPGHTGQDSFAILSHTVNMKSNLGAFSLVNSSQLFERALETS